MMFCGRFKSKFHIPDCPIMTLPRLIVGVIHLLYWLKALFISLWMRADDWRRVIIYWAPTMALIDYLSQPQGAQKLRKAVTCPSGCIGFWIPKSVWLVFSSLLELFLTFFPLLCLCLPLLWYSVKYHRNGRYHKTACIYPALSRFSVDKSFHCWASFF